MDIGCFTQIYVVETNENKSNTLRPESTHKFMQEVPDEKYLFTKMMNYI